ncbi:MAG TPA: hypothetical protein DHW85_08845 [Lachnospiraceae bacterium]|nr:hypothetical protein [Lachnospiraceae bacterium]
MENRADRIIDEKNKFFYLKEPFLIPVFKLKNRSVFPTIFPSAHRLRNEPAAVYRRGDGYR